MRHAVLAGALLVIVSGAPRSVAPAPEPLKLAVILVVDQMRADYIDRFKADWTSGLKRLVNDGAWFRRAAYPYLSTVTCPGHATISSGAFPRTHGVFQNEWWDRDRHKMVTCTEDSHAHDVGYSTAVSGGDSAYRLVVPSFADEMRNQRAAHVVTLSLKGRSAIMLAGHGGDAVTWSSDSFDGWVTSSAFTTTGPVPEVKAFTDANPIDADFGKTWTRLVPESSYAWPDDGEGEKPPPGWTRTFPHELKGGGDRPDATFHQQWALSPYADAYVGRFAAALTESLQLGRHDGTDVLGVSFSSPDLIGHAFGPWSQEVQDTYARLDRTIGALLDRIDALVGRDRYVVALTADHGATPIPEQLVRRGHDAGRLSAAAIVHAAEQRAQAALGPGKYVAQLNDNDFYLEPGRYQELTATPAALDGVIRTLSATPGVAKVFRSEQLQDATKSADPLRRAAALSYFPGLSGDLILVFKPGWVLGSSATTHGGASPDDQRVPILFMGRGIKPGQYLQPVTPADVAPTLAAVCGISMPKAEGHALLSALTAVPNATRPVVSQPAAR